VSKLLDALDVAGDVLTGEVTATLETNVLPPLTVYGGAGGGGGGLLDALGIRAGIVVRSRDGKQIAKAGDPAAWEPLRAALLAAAVIAAVAGVVVLVRKLR